MEKVLLKLKTRAASLGFNVDELKGIAAVIADNLNSEATDEDIDAQIEAVLPYLKVGQQQAQRIIKSAKPAPTTHGDDDGNASATEKNPKKTEDEPDWFRSYRETQEKRFAALELEKTTSDRKAKLEALLKDTGKHGEAVLKNFNRMKFENDKDFDDYLSETEEYIEVIRQGQGDENLSTVTKPVGGGDGKGKKEKLLTDAEMDEIVAGIN